VPETQAVLQAGSVALTLLAITFCCASSESLDPPPQAASTLPSKPKATVLFICDFMLPPISQAVVIGY
jgi:hypothetical protein